MRLGDIAHAFVLFNTVAFMLAVIVDALGLLSGVFALSGSFKKHGFCVTAPATLANSHLLCFYGDTIGALAVAILGRSGARSGTKGVDAVARSSAGVFGHGVAHLALWNAGGAFGDVAAGPRIFEPVPAGEGLVRLAGLTVFFGLLFRSVGSISAPWLHSVLHAATLSLLVPPRFSFTYVQTALMLVASVCELGRADKDIFYDVHALMVSLPVGFFGWLEAMSCDVFLINMGGHAWYDWSIWISLIAYYFVARYALPQDGAVAQKKIA
mmetsp:Transcript_65199/g.108325  ORF Transcript_65199/g.108325 Transcript_65199/m.108325 type:complete len:268 (-) Transcript_65199:162-965(-)|eukprot:CAMPEP_0119335060 /NCGR_PEP_ID=MMETSP1333-20130426/88608_1 /TAXON_ID=418940 /ORGANISM="Scyphosphaera apsteinii, Strain RCC1455" /LENGTH=267 /DNA_ID=CAMNT_0007345515 /DNA_START=18 /DNA_END=821 /DNA_ORIENTATION=-